MAAKAFAFTKLIVGDIEQAERFYCSTLGFTRTATIEAGEGEGQLREFILSLGDQRGPQLILIQYLNRPTPAPGESVLGFMVDDVPTSVDTMIAAGAKVVVPVTEVPEHGLKLAYVSDPQGHLIEILQPL